MSLRGYILGTEEPVTPRIIITAVSFWLLMLVYVAFIVLVGYLAFEAMRLGV